MPYINSKKHTNDFCFVFPQISYTILVPILCLVEHSWFYKIFACLQLGWGVKLLCANPIALIGARALIGFGAGGAFVVCPLYVKEISEDSIRGMTGTFIIFSQVSPQGTKRNEPCVMVDVRVNIYEINKRASVSLCVLNSTFAIAN